MCHVSHLYETGASLYFTFVARQHAGAEGIEQWQAAKAAASSAIVQGGGGRSPTIMPWDATTRGGMSRRDRVKPVEHERIACD